MPVTLSPRLQAIALTPMERIAIYVERKLAHFRPYFDEPFEAGIGECDCGKPAVKRNECPRCKKLREEAAKDRTAFHNCERPYRLTAEEWQEARVRKSERQQEHGRQRRLRLRDENGGAVKVNQSLDNEPEPMHPLDRLYAGIR